MFAVVILIPGINMSSNVPRVAVVIATYNRWPLVTRAVDSVLSQSHAGTRCVVVDDASSDGTPANLLEKYGDRITLIQQPVNREKSAARNLGVQSADADYVCFLDSDDELTRDSVSSRLEVFLRDPRFDGVAYGFCTNAGRLPENLKDLPAAPPEGNVVAEYLRTYFVHNNGFLIKRTTMLQLGMYQESLTHREDREILIRLAAQLEFRCSRSNVADIHLTRGSARFEYEKASQQGMRMVQLLRANPGIARQLGTHLRAAEQKECWEWLRGLYKSGDYRTFRKMTAANLGLFDVFRDRASLCRRYLASFVREWFWSRPKV
ncbi:MAG TPA: glycosyltransferase family 2 protein [Candidatus Sulfotelmatobacter sp.]|nr:glycosyltransferase family 2 protein [Candidatus Sulfotelmatobacter sp.]